MFRNRRDVELVTISKLKEFKRNSSITIKLSSAKGIKSATRKQTLYKIQPANSESRRPSNKNENHTVIGFSKIVFLSFYQLFSYPVIWLCKPTRPLGTLKSNNLMPFKTLKFTRKTFKQSQQENFLKHEMSQNVKVVLQEINNFR